MEEHVQGSNKSTKKADWPDKPTDNGNRDRSWKTDDAFEKHDDTKRYRTVREINRKLFIWRDRWYSSRL